MQIKRGEIYWVEFSPGKGSEQGGLRPALIVQNDTGNSFGSTTVVAAITRTLPRRAYPFVVVIEPQDSGLPERSAINCGQIATIQKDGPQSPLRSPRGETIVRPIGRVVAAKMVEVDEALKYSLGLG